MRICCTIITAALLCILTNARCQQSATQQKQIKSMLTQCLEQDDLAIRFFYSPPEVEDHYRFPRVFMPVPAGDPRLGTRSGYVVYANSHELHTLFRILAKMRLDWRESASPIPLVVEPRKLPTTGLTSMEIAISCQTGSAITLIEPSDICTSLERLDHAFDTDTTLRHFQNFRIDLGCSVAKGTKP